MTEPYVVKPDQAFINRIVAEGGDDVKKCFQCATCSVVCELSNGETPFPRKEMIWAQWGLKDRLMADPDIWLCHQCNDCSTRCPRGAHPGDVLSALRQEHVENYAIPRFLAVWANRTQFLPLMLLIPVLLLGGAVAVRDQIGAMLPEFLQHPGFYADFFPHWLLIGFFSGFTGLAALAALVGIVRFWTAMQKADKADGRTGPTVGLVPSVIGVITSILTHNKFSKCTGASGGASRKPAHFFAFYGFVALFVVTIWAVIDLYVNPHLLGIPSMYPFGLMHPMKILANIGCILLIVGCIKAIMDRKNKQEEMGRSTPFDLLFVWLLLGVGVTGLATEIMRFGFEPQAAVHAEHEAAPAEAGEGDEAAAAEGEHAAGHHAEPLTFSKLTAPQKLAWGIYFIHLVLVFDLLVYLPYSKFAHIMYRTVALIYAEHTGRGKAKVATA